MYPRMYLWIHGTIPIFLVSSYQNHLDR
jgi:hypothetical protein